MDYPALRTLMNIIESTFGKEHIEYLRQEVKRRDKRITEQVSENPTAMPSQEERIIEWLNWYLNPTTEPVASDNQ